jgi:phosphohistidine phosphatase SixA
MRQLADSLRRLKLFPSVYLSSHHKHAKESAAVLAQELSKTPGAPIVSLRSLTPQSPTSSFEEIIDEFQTMQWDWNPSDVMAVVGHEPQLSQRCDSANRSTNSTMQ